MRITLYLTTLLLNWIAYDLNLFRGKRDAYASLNYATYDSLKEQKQVKKLIKLNVIPPWLRAMKRPRVRMKVNHFSGKSRDVRDSNQRKIRRKFNNM